LNLGISDHDIILVDLLLKPKKKKIQKRTVYIRRKANIDIIKSDMSSFCDFYMDSLLNAPVDVKWSKFVEAMQETMKSNVPHKTTSRRFNLPWFNRSHRPLCRKKQKLFNKAKKSKKQEDWVNVRSIRKRLHNELSKSRNQYTSEFLVQSVKDNPKSFWSHIKKVKSGNVGVTDLEINGSVVSKPKIKAEALNSQFISVFIDEDLNHVPTLGNSVISNIHPLKINCKGVETQLLKLKDDKAPGPDQLYPWLLKMAAIEIAPIYIVTDIFQTSIDSANLPNQWSWKPTHVVFTKKEGKVIQLTTDPFL
jgi:hypothetical protein